MAAVTICSDFGAQKIKSATVSTVFPSICHEVMGLYAMILVFSMLSIKPDFSLTMAASMQDQPKGEGRAGVGYVTCESCAAST